MQQNKAEKSLAIVTGGGSGLGFAIARKFIEHGIRTIIVGRNKAKLEESSIELGEDCIPITFDITDLDRISELIETIRNSYGNIDILVNNAGIHLKKELFEVDHADFQRVLLTNLVSAFTLTKEVAKKMVEKKKGSIINISSMAAQYGIPKVIAYSASKAGIEGMTRALAVELSPLGIRVNCIAPGFIKTRMSSEALNKDPERKAKVLSRTPLGKLGQPEDVANLAYFLTSEETSYITGAIIPVDGGNLIGF
jgi:NAD(P)-dependent dehydrogenase (short-subunit alcohol dehydrogenase family)